MNLGLFDGIRWVLWVLWVLSCRTPESGRPESPLARLVGSSATRPTPKHSLHGRGRGATPGGVGDRIAERRGSSVESRGTGTEGKRRRRRVRSRFAHGLETIVGAGGLRVYRRSNAATRVRVGGVGRKRRKSASIRLRVRRGQAGAASCDAVGIERCSGGWCGRRSTAEHEQRGRGRGWVAKRGRRAERELISCRRSFLCGCTCSGRGRRHSAEGECRNGGKVNER